MDFLKFRKLITHCLWSNMWNVGILITIKKSLSHSGAIRKDKFLDLKILFYTCNSAFSNFRDGAKHLEGTSEAKEGNIGSFDQS